MNDHRVIRFGYQRERCPKTGRLHWQGWLELSEGLAKADLFKLMGRHPQYLEPSRSQAIVQYCQKEDTRYDALRAGQERPATIPPTAPPSGGLQERD